MTTSAKVARGVQAIEVNMLTGRQSLHVVITREALEELGPVGPEQHDLLTAFHVHQEEIEAAILAQWLKLGRISFVLTNLRG